MSGKRVNPRRRPATLADVEKAKKQAQSEAVKYAWAIMFSVMRDKEGWGIVRLKRLWDEVEDLSDSIEKGYVSVRELLDTLEEEIGAILEWQVTRRFLM